MLYTVSFDRLYLPFEKKGGTGKRIYDIRVLDKADMIKIQQCILHGIRYDHIDRLPITAYAYVVPALPSIGL